MAAVSPLPAYSNDVPGAGRFSSPSFSGNPDALAVRTTIPSTWSNPSSPSFHRECNQVYETLGSLQKALSLSGEARFDERAHRQEADSLWRENRELRSEVRVWQGEAKTLQQKNAELQLQVAQLLAELDAERAVRASAPQAPALSSSTTSLGGAGAGGSSSQWFQTTPRRDLATSSNAFAGGLGFRAGQEASEAAVAAAATPSRRRAGTRGGTSGCLSGAEEAELSSRHADELVALSARHAGEVAELHVRHAHTVEMLQGEADVARSGAGMAERRCRWAERKASRAEAATVTLSIEVARLVAQMTLFAAWRHATSQVRRLSASKSARMLAAGWAFRIRDQEIAKCYCWLIWLSTLREAAEQRRLQDFEVELLRSRFLRHAQLSWLSSRWLADEAMLIVLDALRGWRTAVVVILRGELGSKLQTLQLRHGGTRNGLDRLSELTNVQNLVRQVVMAWHFEARTAQVAHLKDQAAQATVTRLDQVERQAAGLRDRLAVARDGSLKQKAWLALWWAVHARARDAQEEALRIQSARAEEARSLAQCLDNVTTRAIQSCVRYQDEAAARCTLQAWCAMVVEARWGRIVEVLEERLVGMRRRGRVVLLRLVSWGCCKVLLHRALGGWLRLLLRGPGALGDGGTSEGGRVELERKLRLEREHSHIQRKALLQTMSNLLAAAQVHEMMFGTWSSWQEARRQDQRSQLMERFSRQDTTRRKHLDRVHVLLFGSASRVQAGFIMRACWATWRRLRPVQRLLSGGEELCKLRASHAYLQHTRSSQVLHLGERLEQQRDAAVVYMVWTAWRRRRRESALLCELEDLQQLLSCFQAECQRQQECVIVDAWMDVKGLGESGDHLDSSPTQQSPSVRSHPQSIAELQSHTIRSHPQSTAELQTHMEMRSQTQLAVQSFGSLPQPHPMPQEPLRPAAWPPPTAGIR